MATDWPYGVSYDGGNHPTTWNKAGRRISSDEKTRHWDDYREAGELGGFYSDCLRIALEHALVSRPVIYTFFAMMKAPVVFAAWLKVGLLPHQVCVWEKSRHVLSRCDYMWNYEPLLYGWVQGQAAAPRPPPAGGSHGGLVGRFGHRGRPGRPASHPEAGRAHQAADRVPHPRR